MRTLRSGLGSAYISAMGPRKVAPPRRVRIAHGRAPWAWTPLTVVHIGHSSIVLAPDPNGLPADDVALTDSLRGLVPGGICLPDPDDFAQVRDAATRSETLNLTAWAELTDRQVTRVDLTVMPLTPDCDALDAWQSEFAAEHEGSADPVMDPWPLRDLARPLATAALDGGRENGRAVIALLRDMVGAGPGTTPTGDDTIVGVLAALDAGATVMPDPDVCTAARARITAALGPLLHRTTRASRHDLDAATHGYFAEKLHAVLASTASRALVPDAARAARAWGATSGIDLAHAVVTTLDVMVDLARTTPIPRNDPADPPTSPTHRRSA